MGGFGWSGCEFWILFLSALRRMDVSVGLGFRALGFRVFGFKFRDLRV